VPHDVLRIVVAMSSLTAFPADGYKARWGRWDLDGDEALTLRWENEGWTATGELSRERANYVVRISPTWQVRQFLLFRSRRTRPVARHRRRWTVG
jgi:hypothetical protein